MAEFLPFSSRRSTVYARGGMVAASQPLAVAAGLELLRKGGSAADAAVAVAAALNVTEPSSTGLGGDAFMLYYQADTRQVFALNGSGRAPAALTLERLRKDIPSGELPALHPHCVTVPGACAAWCDTLERFGHLSMAEVLAPATRLAEEGFPVPPITAYYWQRSADHYGGKSANFEEMTLNGRGPRAGELFRNPGLVKALGVIATGGKQAFYQGKVAEAIAAVVQGSGGCMTTADLAAHTSTWVEPISIPYRSLRVWECPPNGQGMAALLALNILEGFDLAGLPAVSVERLHLEIEAMRLAFADTRRYNADPAFNPPLLDWLLSKEYAAQRRALIHPRQAIREVAFGTPPGHSDTVYFSVVDTEGNACSFINSNYMGFGTGIVPKGWGFTLQNRGHNFSLDPAHPNVLAPGKRPYHTIIPSMATREADGSLAYAFGVMGGFMQPQGHLQVVVALEDDALDPQSALDRPRFCIEPDDGRGMTSLEEGIPLDVMAGLAEMGHPLRPVSGMNRGLFGRGQVIGRMPDSGVLFAGSDPRSDGCAMGLI